MGTNPAPGHILPETLVFFPLPSPLPSSWSCSWEPLCTLSLVYKAMSPRPLAGSTSELGPFWGVEGAFPLAWQESLILEIEKSLKGLKEIPHSAEY